MAEGLQMHGENWINSMYKHISCLFSVYVCRYNVFFMLIYSYCVDMCIYIDVYQDRNVY